MSEPPGKSPSKYHDIFSRKPLHIGNNKISSYITYIWEDEHIEMVGSNKWKCLSHNFIFRVSILSSSRSCNQNQKYVHKMILRFNQLSSFIKIKGTTDNKIYLEGSS